MKVHQLMLLAGLSLSTILSSCEKENILPRQNDNPAVGTDPGGDPTTPPPTNNTPPVTPAPVTLDSRLAQQGSQVFRYDAQNRLVEVAYTDHTNGGYAVVYEGDRPVRLNFKTGGSLVYEYLGDKVVKVYNAAYGDQPGKFRFKLEYQGDKLVKKTEISYARNAEGQIGVTRYTYDSRGNLTEYSIAWSTSLREEDLGRPSLIKWGNFDHKPNPKPFADSQIYLPGIKMFENNPGFRDPGSGKEFYTYVYHESGMPHQQYTKLESHPHAGPFITKYTYK
jgi:YD repeat-containing protein